MPSSQLGCGAIVFDMEKVTHLLGGQSAVGPKVALGRKASAAGVAKPRSLVVSFLISLTTWLRNFRRVAGPADLHERAADHPSKSQPGGKNPTRVRVSYPYSMGSVELQRGLLAWTVSLFSLLSGGERSCRGEFVERFASTSYFGHSTFPR